MCLGTLIDPTDDPDRTLSQKVHNRFERMKPQIAGSPEDLSDLLEKMRVFEPGKRRSARELLTHRWFHSTVEEPAQ
jgi:serine/threonine protein kinase